MISLNITSITDEIFALTALRAAIYRSQDIPPVLTRDNLPALRVMVRSAFVATIAQLMPYVVDSKIDDANPTPERPYNASEAVTLQVDFGDNIESLPTNSLLLIKRHLEHLIALTTLAAVYGPINPAIAASQTTEAAALVSSLLSLLDTAPFPSPVQPCF